MKRAPPGILPVSPSTAPRRSPLYRQIYEGYREAIVERRLRPGQRLPSTRSLAARAADLPHPGAQRVRAAPGRGLLREPRRRGHLRGRARCPTSRAPRPPRRRPARGGPAAAARRPRPERPAPRGARALARGLGRLPHERARRRPLPVPRSGRAWWPPRAQPAAQPAQLRRSRWAIRPFREALADYLRTARAVRCEADQIMVVSGSQQALEIAARVLLDPGSPSGWRSRATAARATSSPWPAPAWCPVPVDDEGLDVAAGIARCPRPRAAYVTPSHQYPLGVTMSASRRLQLLDWAQPQRRVDPRGRLRQRVPLREPAGRGAAGPGPRRARHLHRHLQQGAVPRAARRLRRDPARPRAGASPRCARPWTSSRPRSYQAVLADFIERGPLRAPPAADAAALSRAAERPRRGPRQELGRRAVLGDEAGMHLVATLPGPRATATIALRAAARACGRCRSRPATWAARAPGPGARLRRHRPRRSRRGAKAAQLYGCI